MGLIEVIVNYKVLYSRTLQLLYYIKKTELKVSFPIFTRVNISYVSVKVTWTLSHVTLTLTWLKLSPWTLVRYIKISFFFLIQKIILSFSNTISELIIYIFIIIIIVTNLYRHLTFTWLAPWVFPSLFQEVIYVESPYIYTSLPGLFSLFSSSLFSFRSFI